MKVLHLRDQYLGVSFIYFLLLGFKKYKHEIVCREIKKEDLIKYPYNHITKTSSFFSITWIINKIFIIVFKNKIFNSSLPFYFAIKKKEEVIVIHAHMGTQGYYAIPLAAKLKKPLVVTFYGSDMSDVPKLPGWHKKYLKLFKVVSKIIVEGPFMKSKMVELGCPEDKIEIVKIGIPLNHLQFNYRPKYSNSICLNILMCANFYPKKGYLKALNALKILKDQEELAFTVDIIGSGPMLKQIQDLIKTNSLEKNVKLLGSKSLDEIYRLSKDYHVFFHPSETAPDGGSEGGAPTIIIEMQALGLPIISTKHADIPNIIPVENHFLSDEYDVNGLVKIFNKFTSLNNWDSISEVGCEFVKKEHSNILCSGKIEQIYQDLIKF